MPYKILIIEENDILRNLLAEEFASSPDFTVLAEKNLRGEPEQTSSVNLADINLLMLEVGKNLSAGQKTVKALREADFRVPIILIGDKGGDFESLLGGDGANDYVTKPFRLTTLLARIKAQLRQYEQNEDAAFTLGSYILKPGQKILLDKNRHKIRLTEKEAAILKYLYQAEKRAVERDRLLEEVWGYNSGVSTHTLETHIYRLRQKIEKDPANAKILLTVQGGYRLVP